MFVQTQKTPNPNSLKFLPGKKVSEDGPYEILNKDETNNNLIRNILSINGVTGIFLGEDFLSVNKEGEVDWENCSGCPSSTLTLKQGVQNLLCHYVPEVKEVLAV